MKKVINNAIAIIIALFITSAVIAIFNVFNYPQSFNYLSKKILNAIDITKKEFWIIYKITALMTLPLFFIFSSWGKNKWRKILVPTLILGYIARIFMAFAITWVAPEYGLKQKLSGYIVGYLCYLSFYGSYCLFMYWLTKSKSESL